MDEIKTTQINTDKTESTPKKRGRPKGSTNNNSKKKTTSTSKTVLTQKPNSPDKIVEEKKIVETVDRNTNMNYSTKKIDIPLDTEILCVSAVHGKMSYKSKITTGLKIVWVDYASEQFIALRELVSMRNTDHRFFKDNWIIILDSNGYTQEEILEFLRVKDLYKDTLDLIDFDSVFKLDPDTIKVKLSGLSSGVKDTVAIRAKQLYNNGELDSKKSIKAVEEALGIEIE